MTVGYRIRSASRARNRHGTWFRGRLEHLGANYWRVRRLVGWHWIASCVPKATAELGCWVMNDLHVEMLSYEFVSLMNGMNLRRAPCQNSHIGPELVFAVIVRLLSGTR